MHILGEQQKLARGSAPRFAWLLLLELVRAEILEGGARVALTEHSSRGRRSGRVQEGRC